MTKNGHSPYDELGGVVRAPETIGTPEDAMYAQGP